MGIKFGFNNVNKLFVGSNPVSKVYYGTNLVFSSEKGDLSQWRYSTTEISGKTLLQEYIGSDWNNTIYVPIAQGRTVLNTGAFRVNNTNSKFISVDLQKVPFKDNTMYFAFSGCKNLTEVFNIPDSVINMSFTFNGCPQFNSFIKFPRNGVSSVSSLVHSSNGESLYNKPTFFPTPKISGLKGMSLDGAFNGCSNFNERVYFPEEFPIDLFLIFKNCSNLNRNITIPRNVASFSFAFENCSNFKSWVNIHSASIGGATYQGGTGSANNSFSWNGVANSGYPSVMIPIRYINNSATTTLNAFKSAGWNITGVGNLVGPSDSGGRTNKIYGYDFIKSYYNTYTGNGTHWILSKWNGLLCNKVADAFPWDEVVVPEYFNTYNTFPTALDRPCFKSNTSIFKMDFGTDIPWTGNTMGSGTNASSLNTAFQGCKEMVVCKGVINNSVTSVTGLFYNCANLVGADVIFPDAPASYYSVFSGTQCVTPPPIGRGATNLQSMFWNDILLRDAPVIPPNVTSMVTTFANGGQNKLTGSIFILSPNVSNITNTFRSPNTSLRKDIYIYYKYSNGVNTVTYNKFTANNWYKGSTTAGADPMYNTTSNFYLHDITNAYNSMWDYTYYIAPAQKRILLKKYKGAFPQVAVMANYPEWNANIFEVNCFNNCRHISYLSLYDAEILANDATSSCSNLFRNCYNLHLVQGLNLSKVKISSGVAITNVNLYKAFENCGNLGVFSRIPNTVTNMAYTFNNCGRFNFNLQLNNSVDRKKHTSELQSRI